MKIHEYQAKAILARYGVPVPSGEAVFKAADAKAVAERLGLSMAETAMAIVRIADNNMVGALRSVLIERGLDPRDFTLVAFGGAGALHAVRLAEALSIRDVLVPPGPVPGEWSRVTPEQRPPVCRLVIPAEWRAELHRVLLAHQLPSDEIEIPSVGRQRKHPSQRRKTHGTEERGLLDALEDFVLLRRRQCRKAGLSPELCTYVASQLVQALHEGRQVSLRKGRIAFVDEVDNAGLTRTRSVVTREDAARERFDFRSLLAREDQQRRLRLGDLVRGVCKGFATFRGVGEEPHGADRANRGDEIPA